MPKSPSITVPFRPATIEDVFALYLSRELSDVIRVRWYARLSHRFSMCTLLNALRRARVARGREVVAPEHFLTALEEMTEEPIT